MQIILVAGACLLFVALLIHLCFFLAESLSPKIAPLVQDSVVFDRIGTDDILISYMIDEAVAEATLPIPVPENPTARLVLLDALIEEELVRDLTPTQDEEEECFLDVANSSW